MKNSRLKEIWQFANKHSFNAFEEWVMDELPNVEPKRYEANSHDEMNDILEQFEFDATQQLSLHTPQLADENERLRKENEWISVEDRLPELNQRVLCLENDGSIEIANYIIDKVWGYPRDGKPNFIDEQDEQPGCCYPTHWRPIPSPPTISKEGEK